MSSCLETVVISDTSYRYQSKALVLVPSNHHIKLFGYYLLMHQVHQILGAKPSFQPLKANEFNALDAWVNGLQLT